VTTGNWCVLQHFVTDLEMFLVAKGVAPEAVDVSPVRRWSAGLGGTDMVVAGSWSVHQHFLQDLEMLPVERGAPPVAVEIPPVGSLLVGLGVMGVVRTGNRRAFLGNQRAFQHLVTDLDMLLVEKGVLLGAVGISPVQSPVPEGFAANLGK